MAEEVGAECWRFYELLVFKVGSSVDFFRTLTAGIYLSNKQNSRQGLERIKYLRQLGDTVGAIMIC